MTTLSGNPNNFIRIRESEYQADISAAEERGKAFTAASMAATAKEEAKAAESSAKEREAAEALRKLKALEQERNAEEAAAQDPSILAAKLSSYVAEQAAQGRRIGYAQAQRELREAQ